MVQPSSVKKIYISRVVIIGTWCWAKSLVSFYLKPKNNGLLRCPGISESRLSVYINIKHTRMDWSFLLLISPIKHQGQCFPLLRTYPSTKCRISTPNRFFKTCDVNMRSCKFLWQIFHLKIWLKLFPRYLSTEYNTINSPSRKELLQL